jgi:hypothetical protein
VKIALKPLTLLVEHDNVVGRRFHEKMSFPELVPSREGVPYASSP